MFFDILILCAVIIILPSSFKLIWNTSSSKFIAYEKHVLEFAYNIENYRVQNLK